MDWAALGEGTSVAAIEDAIGVEHRDELEDETFTERRRAWVVLAE